MRMKKYFILLLLAIFTLVSCKKVNENYQKDISKPIYIHDIMKKYTDIIVHDIFSPPVASRNYLYASIAAYESARHLNPEYKSLAGQLRGLNEVPKPDPSKKINFELATINALFLTCKKFIFSEADLIEFQNKMMKDIEAINIPKDVYKNSMEYGALVSKHILEWADKDNYKQSRSFPKFAINAEEKERWRPTPPGYMDAIEPHWRSIRAILLDSAAQFRPIPPTKFDLNKNSAFMKDVMAVYNIGKNLTEEQKNIANFWDCNPYKLNVIGHVMHASKKISPGGHWMDIARQTTIMNKDDFAKTTMTYAFVAIGLFEGFISCWDEKYRSNSIRPESIINENVDDSWVPLLQTPPFPEYTSGHSVISSASAEILSNIYGDAYAFTDSTEVRFGLGTRSYKSFREAAEEASISRFYGGIHFMPAIVNGAEQGKKLGQFVINKVKFK
jgi:hypothetical protein